MVYEQFETESSSFPLFVHDGTRASRCDAILDFMGDDACEWESCFWLAMAGLERYKEGDNIEFTDILEVLAGELVTLESIWITM